jgi:ribonuclease III
MSVADLEHAIGHVFARSELLAEALTHPSALASGRGGHRHPKAPKRGYDRLEFLCDRVLGLIIADLLWRRFTDEPEGALTRRHTYLVRREALIRIAAAIGLGSHIILSPAEAAAGGATNPAILADVCEAVLAAVYVDGGFEAACRFVERFWYSLFDEMSAPPRDPKSDLQEWAQARGLGLPAYELRDRSGPDHALVFTVAVSVGEEPPVTASGSSKRTAEARAAALLLDRVAAKEGKG